jgi:hypothetical protein
MPTQVQQRSVRSTPTVNPNGLGVVTGVLAIAFALALLASFTDALTATTAPPSDPMLWAPDPMFWAP